jgi:hypothetical protein
MNNNINAGADFNTGDGGYSESTKEKYDEFVKIRNQSLGKMRIKELAEQVDREFDNPGARHKAIERFAELIVRECAEICLEANDHKNILQHFGVE